MLSSERDLSGDRAAGDGGPIDRAVDQRRPERLLISELELYCNHEQESLGLLVGGHQGRAPLAELWVTLLDAEGGALTLPGGVTRVPLDPNISGSTFEVDAAGQFQLSAGLRFELEGRTADALAGLRLELIDEAGERALQETDCRSPEQLSRDASGCDPLAAFARCAPGQGCDEAGACRSGTPPELQRAEVAVDAQEGLFSLRLEGADAEQDVTGALLLPLNAAREPLLERRILLTLHPSWRAEQLSAVGGGQLPTQRLRSREIVAFQVALLDALGFQSEPLEIASRTPRSFESGALCDPFEAFGRCPDDEACVLSDGALNAPALCAPPPRSCPEGWPLSVVELNGEPPWTLPVLPLREEPIRAPGSCAGGAYQAIYQLRAERAGRYRLRLLGGDPAQRIIARTHCGLPAPRFERGCGERLELDLSAGQSLTLIVTGAPAPAELEIILSAEREGE